MYVKSLKECSAHKSESFFFVFSERSFFPQMSIFTKLSLKISFSAFAFKKIRKNQTVTLSVLHVQFELRQLLKFKLVHLKCLRILGLYVKNCLNLMKMSLLEGKPDEKSQQVFVFANLYFEKDLCFNKAFFAYLFLERCLTPLGMKSYSFVFF